MNGRRVAAFSASLLIAPLLAACGTAVQGIPLAQEGATSEEEPTTTTSSRSTRSSTSSSSTPRTSSTRPPAGPLTIGTPKKMDTPPDCTRLLTVEEINQITKGTATKDASATATFCSYKIASGGTASSAAAILALSYSIEMDNAEQVTFEGNSAYRRKTNIGCDLRIALHSDTKAPGPRAMWVSMFAAGSSGTDACATTEQLAKTAFNKLAAG